MASSKKKTTKRKRGRPSEQLNREICEGRVWTIISRLRAKGDFGRTIREVARLCGRSVGAVHKTLAWKGYNQEKSTPASRRLAVPATETRRLRPEESVEGRVIQIVKQAVESGSFTLSVRKIAEMIGCQKTAVAKTQAWKGYVRARSAEKEAEKSQSRGKWIRIK